ncbi:MAG TPA: peptidoglycan-binding domain-containing protein [Burkholderiales bacterium]|nr:peptidoglycan-binding domain-containing protein [Burkholderiales bacterium]
MSANRELELEREVGRGNKGAAVRRVQEWLNLRGYGVSIDGDFGGVTEDAVMRFQRAHRLRTTGRVGARTFARLVEPMASALRWRKRKPSRLATAVLMCASAHLAQHPREVGGPNRGPWVRLYMKGVEGQPWCAGFVSFVLAQAAAVARVPMPIAGSVSCDELAAQARAKNILVAEDGRAALRAGAIFLVRRTPTDWTHTGFVAEARPDLFTTIEGNTNDDGQREGYEVCRLSRGYKNKDFILV